MSTPINGMYRPELTGDRKIDEAHRQAFDYIYNLQGQVNDLLTMIKSLQQPPTTGG